MLDYDLILNIINTILTALSVIFIIFGWIIPYKQSQKQQKEQRKYDESISEKQYNKEKIDEQISKLYVPLYTISMENKIQINILLKKLNRNYVFAKGETINNLTESDLVLWINFLKNHFVPNLNRMKEILNNNIHLIYEPNLPSSYQRFLKYTLKLTTDLNLYLNDPNIDHSNSFVDENYPNDFDIYINKTLDKLLQLQRNGLAQNDNRNTIISNFDVNINNIDYSEKTIVFDNEDNSPYLIDLQNNEKIVINSRQFIIGRKSNCNYVIDNIHVSSLSLMITYEDENWYIMDLNTMNGTSLNNIKIPTNSKMLLQDKSIIQVANLKYKFCL